MTDGGYAVGRQVWWLVSSSSGFSGSSGGSGDILRLDLVSFFKFHCISADVQQALGLREGEGG